MDSILNRHCKGKIRGSRPSFWLRVGLRRRPAPALGPRVRSRPLTLAPELQNPLLRRIQHPSQIRTRSNTSCIRSRSRASSFVAKNDPTLTHPHVSCFVGTSEPRAVGRVTKEVRPECLGPVAPQNLLESSGSHLDRNKARLLHGHLRGVVGHPDVGPLQSRFCAFRRGSHDPVERLIARWPALPNPDKSQLRDHSEY